MVGEHAKPVGCGVGVWQAEMKARSADGRHDGYEYNKQKRHALEALCLLAAVGVVGETFAEARNEFPAPPRPNET